MKTIQNLYKELAALVTKPEADRRMRNWLTRAILMAKKVEPVKKVSADFKATCERILLRFKEVTGFDPRLTDPLKANIKARLNDGYTEEDFYNVFEIKACDWLEDPERRKNLNLTTLLRPANFPRYVEQYGIWQATRKDPDKFTPKKKQKFKPWFSFANLESLSTYYYGLGEANQHNYNLPGYVDELLQKLPLARLKRTATELQAEFEEMKHRDHRGAANNEPG